MGSAEMSQWAAQLLAAYDAGTPLDPLTASHPDLSVAEAYAIAAELLQLRTARGEQVLGWKIGFTNRTIWDEYDVHSPIWGPMFSTTISQLDGQNWQISHLHEPRIEAEVAFRFSATPEAGSAEAALLNSIDAVCHGYEIVQSPFPGWRFKPVDTMAAGGLHGNFVHGPWTKITPADRAFWLEALPKFSLRLQSTMGIDDVGFGANVLDSPLSAVKHFVDGIAAQPHGRSIEAGDIVTTGTVAKAFPITAGERWSTTVTGLPLAGLTILCT